MLKMSVHSKLDPEDVVTRAVEFFKKKHEMKINEQSSTGVCFQDALGKVDVVACADRKGTTVEFSSVEWDHEVREFARRLP